MALAIACFTYSQIYVGSRHFFSQERSQFRFLGNLARPPSGSSDVEEVSHDQSDPEVMIRAFESQPSLHTNSSALAEYVKALVKVDRLDESELLKTLRRGDFLVLISLECVIM